MRRSSQCCARSCGGVQFSRFLPSWRRPRSGSKPVEEPIIGLASSRRSGTRPFCCRRKCEAVCSTGEERCGRCRGDLRGDEPPRMRFVPVKIAEQQAAQMLTGVRDQLIRRQTQLTNAIRGYAAEFGLTAAKGLSKIEPLLMRLENDEALPKLAKELFATLGQEYARLKMQIREVEAKLSAWHRDNELSRRPAEVPTIGPIGACLLTIKVTDPHAFLPIGSGFCRVDWADTEGSFHRRQATARRDHTRW